MMGPTKKANKISAIGAAWIHAVICFVIGLPNSGDAQGPEPLHKNIKQR